MAIREIQIPEGSSNFRTRVVLDNSTYVLILQFNQREARWYLDINDIDDVPIVSGQKVFAGAEFNQLVVDDRSPPGGLVAIYFDPDKDPHGVPRDPGFEHLGERVQLLYFDDSEFV